MQKVGYLIICCLVFSGCASLKKSKGTSTRVLSDTIGTGILESVSKQNLSLESYFIQKADVEYIKDGQRQKFLATIKFEYPDKYLISLKSKTGIEGARIFLTKDSIFVNDRINKITYFGKALYLRRKFGIDQGFLPLVFGDIIENSLKSGNDEKCINGVSNSVQNIRGVRIFYRIDCRKRKLVSTEVANSGTENRLGINFQGFKKAENFLYPGEIQMNYVNSNIKINLKIIKMEYPWNGKVVFLPGKGYELTELL